MNKEVVWEELKSAEAYEDAIERSIPAVKGTSPKIGILGAGVSGLVAAYELARKGYEVEVLEATDRVGGRILTDRFQGAHAELGAMRIPGEHYGTRYYSDVVLRLKQQPFANKDPNGLLHVRGVTHLMSDVDHTLPLFDLTEDEIQRLSEQGIQALLGPFVELAYRKLKEFERHDIRMSRIADSSAEVKRLDAISIRDFLYSDESMAELSAEGREWLGNINYLKDIWHSPVTALLKEILQHREQNVTALAEGMDTLPETLFSRLNDNLSDACNVLKRREVVAINSETTRVVVDVRQPDGKVEQKSYDYVLATLPFGVLRRMRLQGLSRAKLASIDRFRYGDATKVLLHFTEKFWESTDAPIFGGCSVTDQIASQIFYPTNPDHALPTASQPDQVMFLPSGGAGTAQLANPPAIPRPDPGVLIGSYSWGTNAQRLGAMPPDERVEVVLRCLRDLHGTQVDEFFAGSGASMAWGQYRWSAGAFGQPAPRDLTVFRHAAMGVEERLYFSGEHLSNDPGWINGSINSTLTALAHMTTRIAER